MRHDSMRNDHADISVLVATYRRPHLVTRALDSIAAQTLQPREIIVVDDASGDETAEVVDRWAQTSKTPVNFIAATANGGAGATRNLGMRAAQSSLIALLDSDDEYLSHALETLHRPLIQNPRSVLSFADARLQSSHGRRFGKVMAPHLPAETALEQIGGDPIPSFRVENPQTACLLNSMIPTCSTLFRRDAAFAAGLMPELRFGEDWLFWLKLSTKGEFMCQMEDVSIVHRNDESETGPLNNRRNALQILEAYLALRRGDYVTLGDQDRARLDAAIVDQTGALRYHSSKEGLAAYWKILSSPAVRDVGGPLRNIFRDPKSALRAAWFSVAPSR